MWLPVALWCKTLPLRVTRKRFAVALWLFIFGICSPFVCCGGDRLGRRLERRHVLGGWLEGRGLLGRVARGPRLLLRQIFQVPLVRSDHHDHVSALLLGIDSTMASSPRSPTRRSKIFRPRSVWAISRPRNMIVILTLFPAERNRVTCPFLVA